MMTPSTLHTYATSGHREVAGWLPQTAIDLSVELHRIQRRHGLTGPVAEIGVHHGRYFILLHLLSEAGEKALAFDLFERQLENVDKSGQGDKDVLRSNLMKFGCDLNRIIIHTANSLHLSPNDLMEQGPLRWLSIDGGHTAEITENDLKLAAQSIHEAGLVVVDDYFNESWPGVSEGVCRFMNNERGSLFPVAIGGNKFIFAKGQEASRLYRSEMAFPSSDFRLRETVAFDEPVQTVYAYRKSQPLSMGGLVRSGLKRLFGAGARG